jgi:proteic killer suppression protein
VRYAFLVLQSFSDEDSERVWRRERVRRFHQDLQRAALRKLVMLDAAEDLSDLVVPPGNRLQKLSGDLAGHDSIRVNDQWRICFRWTKAGPEDISIMDYH